MVEIIYSVVIFIATLIGASAGLGGGVIIKPVLDFIGMHDINTINFLSSSAVFIMSVCSIGQQIKNKVKFDYCIISLVAIGSIIGGYLGSVLFSFLLQIMQHNILKFIQSIILALLLIIVLINVNVEHPNLHIKNKHIMILIGLILGLTSSFLGIGGGPVNVAVFIFFFSMDMKTATLYSIATILFSQASTLLTIATTSGFHQFDLTLLLYILPLAVLGGISGTKINHKASIKQITCIFNTVVSCLILLNILNAVMVLR